MDNKAAVLKTLREPDLSHLFACGVKSVSLSGNDFSAENVGVVEDYLAVSYKPIKKKMFHQSPCALCWQ